jgi:hypothetical protein
MYNKNSSSKENAFGCFFCVRSFRLLIIYVLFSFVKENEGKKETAERKEERKDR